MKHFEMPCRLSAAFVTALLAGLSSLPAQAGIGLRTWLGGDATNPNDYGTAANWSPGLVPISTDIVTFPDSAATFTVNLNANREAFGINFIGTTPYIINGQPDSLELGSEGIAVSASGVTHTVNSNLMLDVFSTPTPHAWSVAGGSNVVVNGNIGDAALPPNTLNKNNAGTLTLNGANTYTANTVVNGGTLVLGHSSAVGTGTIQFPSAPALTVTETFDSTAGIFALNGDAVLDAGTVRLTDAVTGQIGSAVSQSASATPVEHLDASFDFRIGPTTGDGADGVSFALLDSATYGDTAIFGEDGPGADALTVKFDTFQNAGEPGGNFAEVRLNDTTLATAIPTFSLDNQQTHTANLSVNGAGLTLTVTPEGGTAETLFTDLALPGFAQAQSRIGFGARTGGATEVHRIDNVSFTGRTVNNGQVLAYADGVNIANAVEVQANVALHVASGVATQSGTITQPDGPVNITKTGTGTLALTADNPYTGNTVIDAGTLLANNTTGSATGTGGVTVNDGATLGGTGSVAGAVTLNSGGTLAPGESPGQLTVGSATFNTGSTFAVELAGTAPTDYDKLVVSNAATLGGNLDISLLLGFTPDNNDIFTILTTDSQSGAFDNAPAFSRVAVSGGQGSFEVALVGAGDGGGPNFSLQLANYLTDLAGDYNNDGFVSQADLDLVLLNWGDDASLVPTAWINDLPTGIISQNELDGVLLNWGNGTAPGSLTSIPEPASAALLGLGGAAGFMRRRS